MQKTQILNILIVLSTVLFISTNSYSFNSSGKLNSGKKYKIVIDEIDFKKRPDSKPNDGSIWGAGAGYPDTIIIKFEIKIDDKKVYIPSKFYKDLCDINSVRILEDSGFIILIIKGGDAHGSYEAEFKIKNLRLAERIVRHSEFYDEVWEKTILKNDPLDNWNK